MERAGVLVVGGGMAGVSAAAALSERLDVALIEREPQLAHHTTGRSAAAFIESYGSPEIRALTRASRAELEAVIEGEPALMAPRGQLWVGAVDRPHHVGRLDALCAAVPALERLDADATVELCPPLDPEVVSGGAYEAAARDIDVLALLDRFARRARTAGARIRTDVGFVSATPGRGGWEVESTAGPLHAGVVVNAAGAWGDEIAAAFGAEPAPLTPLRRTIAIARPGDLPVDPGWPLVVGVDEDVYFKPEGPNVLLSPADESPSDPCDARPDEVDVALALDRANHLTRLGLRSVLRAWAGLRTFGPDRNPVVGFDPEVEGLFWLAGQGGYGIQTAPAMARLAAALVTGDPVPADIAAEGLDPAALAPGR
jgi:D-arginine dehydrogenase